MKQYAKAYATVLKKLCYIKINIVKEIPMEEIKENGTPAERLDEAEKYIEHGKLDEAQKVLNTIKEDSGRKYYLRSRIYKNKCWYNEQRKQLKRAVKAEPDNEIYKKELEELMEFRKTSEYKSTVKHPQMGDTVSCCLESCCNICEWMSFCN